jgi:hypothetical protein
MYYILQDTPPTQRHLWCNVTCMVTMYTVGVSAVGHGLRECSTALPAGDLITRKELATPLSPSLSFVM